MVADDKARGLFVRRTRAGKLRAGIGWAVKLRSSGKGAL